MNIVNEKTPLDYISETLIVEAHALMNNTVQHDVCDDPLLVNQAM